jgi:hypothetical protein
MEKMFRGAWAFDQSLKRWDLSNVPTQLSPDATNKSFQPLHSIPSTATQFTVQMPKDNNRQRMEAIHDVQSDIVSTISLVGKYTTGNATQRRTKAGYDFYMKSLERTKLQCERGIQAARDGQLLAPPTVGKYTYHQSSTLPLIRGQPHSKA